MIEPLLARQLAASVGVEGDFTIYLSEGLLRCTRLPVEWERSA